MKINWLSCFVLAVICQIGLTAWAIPQQGYLSPQYPVSQYPVSQYPVYNSVSVYDSIPQGVGSVVIEGGYSGVATPSSYPIIENSVSSFPTVSTAIGSPSQVYPASVRNSYYTSTNMQSGLAQQKATQAAQMSFRDHVGGSLGGAKYEGVGWSNQSPQIAIQNCCYWGQRPAAQIGVSKSSDGCWYACVLYH